MTPTERLEHARCKVCGREPEEYEKDRRNVYCDQQSEPIRSFIVGISFVEHEDGTFTCPECAEKEL